MPGAHKNLFNNVSVSVKGVKHSFSDPFETPGGGGDTKAGGGDTKTAGEDLVNSKRNMFTLKLVLSDEKHFRPEWKISLNKYWHAQSAFGWSTFNNDSGHY